MDPNLSMIIYLPAFNEAETVGRVLESLPRKIEGVSQIELLVVDDGSTDGTASISRGKNASVISHLRNRGLGIAFQTAVNYAIDRDVDLLVSIDADGQFDPGDIPSLVGPILAGTAHMVTANRFSDGKPEQMPGSKYWGNKQVSRIISAVSGIHFSDVSCGFRAYSREALLHLNLFGKYSYTHEAILNLVYKGLTIAEYPIKVKYFKQRESKIASNLFRYAYNMTKIIFRSVLDYRPLYFFGNLGLASLAIAFVFIAFLMVRYFITGAFTPYKSFGFIGLGFAIFGLLILFIGLVADMLNRIRLNQDRILYQMRVNPKGIQKDQ